MDLGYPGNQGSENPHTWAILESSIVESETMYASFHCIDHGVGPSSDQQESHCAKPGQKTIFLIMFSGVDQGTEIDDAKWF